ncbi:hypothetical protein B0H17DRAFT_1023511 [Mycena rosella]|uniref:Uncharacterized protein n=1 Tax=Mycena rosella TaxID=1033263 RepID=A0AAD7FT11_MYCRO|nr:hypothetical protein B0H17DRAFT_1023511 [Mycena rosella]
MLSLQSLSLLALLGGTYASFHDFDIPRSHATVKVQAFNLGNVTLKETAHAFFHPVLPGHETSPSPVYAFLVEHKNTRLMFDPGIRKDTVNFVPSVAASFASGAFILNQSKDITELLQDGGVPLKSIDIRSKSESDNVAGDMAKFPNTTKLVIGAGTNISTFPEFPNSSLQASDFAGHNLTEINFAATNLTFAGLKAIDYFGDGSFYLLNTWQKPQHLPGHMSALARVTPTSFVSLGGDAFAHAGQIRPRPAFQKNFPCPAHLLEETASSISTDYFWSPQSRDGAFDMRSRAQQLLAISDVPDAFYVDPVAAQISPDKLAAFDADPDFFVVIAHDMSLVGSLPYFPASLDGWKASGLKERTVWNFANEANPAFVFSPA